MPSISSSRTFSVMSSSSVSTRGHPFLSRFIMSMTVVILLVGFCPYVSSSPTPPSNDQDKQINQQSNGFILDADNSHQTPSLSSSVQEALSDSSPTWYVQPRANAHEFLMSNLNDNEIIVSKRFTRFLYDDQVNDESDDDDVFIPSNKRSAVGNKGTYSNLIKRKQLTKPPMEVMNEIVNSIYLKR
ncbi:unnamed protein product [Adineta ricciae]|uniref:Uncharacterized protein n=1 Tax=Adineta ricciae TaxID=249248 RepID=A0A813WSS8_ADIRI|nr:unnamed protein product [Adineta ricciae]CAF1212454.1 unnamed protein product [Adineta ricciae]